MEKHGGEVIITVAHGAYAKYDEKTGIIDEGEHMHPDDLTLVAIEDALHDGELQVIERLTGWAPYSYLVGRPDGTEYYLVG